MLDQQRTAFADMLDPDELEPMVGASKLHGVSCYTFPYTLGDLLSLGMAERASTEPGGFTDP
ncbi:M3 family oligoendopeptidase [Oceanidesulfovibrio marinus]|nr:M3 family oligoendopeptidase [Oceanidesulfovibrio marinus]